jgi:hypothetical protein
VLGLVTGALAVGLRRSGAGIEAAFLVVAAAQALLAALALATWGAGTGLDRLRRGRRLREREANLRVVKT